MITTQRQLRAQFWHDNPKCDRKTIRDYSGIGRMYCTDTRVAWCDYVDGLQRCALITEALAERATLLPYSRG